MDGLSIVVRAVHFSAVLLLFGEFSFLMGVAGPALRETAAATKHERRELHRRLLQVTSWSLVTAIASGVLWLLVQTVSMSGLPLASTLNRETLGTVLNDTVFGRVAEIRLGLAIALGAMLFSGRHRMDGRGWLILGTCGGLLAGGLLATFAWAGHAAAEQGADRYIHLVADVVHLLAAGAWLGGLPPLLYLLARARQATGPGSFELAVGAARRFSTLGLASVASLLVTGIANTWYTVASVPALFGTQYGRLLLLKLLLFGVMVTLAAINRLRLTPQLAGALEHARGKLTPPALRWLLCTVMTETVLGLAIVAIVGALGVTIPALHAQPVWPFPYTLRWEAAAESAARHTAVLAAGAGTLLALVSMLVGAGTRRRRIAIIGVTGFGSALAVSAWLLAVPAHPTTYFRSPVRYTAASIARGARLFAQNCVTCHGLYGYGDGPAAASLPVKPANLTEEHLFHHGEGNLFWWLQHGIPGTPMPGFSDQMAEPRMWDVINFLRAQAEAEAAKTIADKVEPWRPIVAPDFTFQIDRHPQESLQQQRGRFTVLLVLYTLPESLARLRALNESGQELDRAGVRIVAVPMNQAAVSREAGMPDVDASILADSNSDLVATYNIFRRNLSVDRLPPAPAHTEFLIDREGYLRARWIFTMAQGPDQIPRLLGQIAVLNHEKPRPPAPESHVH